MAGTGSVDGSPPVSVTGETFAEPCKANDFVIPAEAGYSARQGKSSVIRNFLDSPVRANDENGCCAKVSRNQRTGCLLRIVAPVC